VYHRSQVWSKLKASLKSCNFSPPPPASISPTRSSNANNPSPSESNDSSASFASLKINSPPIKPRRQPSSDGETYLPPFSSRWRKTTSNSPALTVLEYLRWTWVPKGEINLCCKKMTDMWLLLELWYKM